jgi:tRNA U34 5-methylaminomethyl-2-thiouridine-forming methyltransferase MnmC
MTTKFCETTDGSITLYSGRFDEHYHSVNGAMSESMHVFIKAGLKECKKDYINIFEVGFGTGLNAYLSLLETFKNNIKINYTAVELFPLNNDIVSKLKYDELLSTKDSSLFLLMHSCDWEKKVEITQSFYLNKIKNDFNCLELNNKYDIIYFDAFSPDKQPDLWSLKNFQKLYNSLNEGGILTSYSSKGFVKQNLRAAGFCVKRLPGANGKRHMLKATKQIE